MCRCGTHPRIVEAVQQAAAKMQEARNEQASECESFFLEPERYEFRALPMRQFALARRDFFKILGRRNRGVRRRQRCFAVQETAPGPHGFHSEELPKEIGAWLHIGEDGNSNRICRQGGNRAERSHHLSRKRSPMSWECRSKAFTWCSADTALTPLDAGTFGSRTHADHDPAIASSGGSSARSVAARKPRRNGMSPADKLIAGDGKITGSRVGTLCCAMRN